MQTTALSEYEQQWQQTNAIWLHQKDKQEGNTYQKHTGKETKIGKKLQHTRNEDKKEIKVLEIKIKKEPHNLYSHVCHESKDLHITKAPHIC
jgi:hypothetical protein